VSAQELYPENLRRFLCGNRTQANPCNKWQSESFAVARTMHAFTPSCMRGWQRCLWLVRSIMFYQIYAYLKEWGFDGIGVFLIQIALLILLIGKLIQFVQFVLKKK
jgi:hypothetical protein